LATLAEVAATLGAAGLAGTIGRGRALSAEDGFALLTR
jgi:hypothetical protein